MNEVIDNFWNAKAKLNELLGIDDYYNVDMHLEAKWDNYAGDIVYIEDETEYGFEGYGSKPDGTVSTDGKYTTFLVDDGCGNQFYTVFNNELRGIDE